MPECVEAVLDEQNIKQVGYRMITYCAGKLQKTEHVLKFHGFDVALGIEPSLPNPLLVVVEGWGLRMTGTEAQYRDHP